MVTVGNFTEEGTRLTVKRPPRTHHVFWARIVACGVVLFPLSLHHVDFRATFSRGLSISAYKSSPAYAAFEDLRENYDAPEMHFPEKAERLVSGEHFDFGDTIGKMPTIRQVSLRGLTIRSQTLPAPQPFYVAGETSLRATPSSPAVSQLKESAPLRVMTEVAPLNIYDNRGQLLPLNVRKQEIATALKNEDWEIPSVASQVRKLLGSSSNTPPPPIQVAQNEADMRSVVLPAHAPGVRPTWITGQVEMAEGLGYLGADTPITLRRMFNGARYEEGTLQINEGRFEIHVKEPVGFLVAEMRTLNGRVVGHGEISLLEYAKAGMPKERIAGLKIALRPTIEGASFTATSGDSYGDTRIALNHRKNKARVEIQSYSDPQAVNDEGVVSDHSLSLDSTFVARGTAQDSWATLIIGHAREPQEIRIFSNKLVAALIDLNQQGTDRKESYRLGVVWGTVKRQGKVTAGATVEMAGHSKPIYFNELYLPDPKLTATSSNGLFAFVKVPAGVQALRVSANGGPWIPSQIFPSENKHVSFVNLDIRDKVVTQFRVFDGFDLSKTLPSRLKLVGSESSLSLQRNEFVELAVAANPFLIEAESEREYWVSRVTVAGAPHVVHVPMISREWLYRLSVDKQIHQHAERGIIVGMVDDKISEVELTGYANGENMQIYYFDNQGNLFASKAEAGVGGGFVIFNAPIGLQTIYIQGVGSRETFSQVVIAEPEVVQVITH